MTIPSFFLGSVIAILYGSVFHMWRGGGPFQIVLYLFLSLAGFWGGNWLANLLGFSFLAYGTLQLGFATITSVITLMIGHWLSKIEDLKI